MWDVMFCNENYVWEVCKAGFQTFDEAMDFVRFKEAETGLIGAYRIDEKGDK